MSEILTRKGVKIEMNTIKSIIGRTRLWLAALLALVITTAQSNATLATDLGDAKDTILADFATAQPLALAIFAVMFGVPLVLAFFKRLAH